MRIDLKIGCRLAALPLLMLLTVTSSLAAQAPTQSLTLGEAFSLARRNNPGFRVQENDRYSAAWNVRTAYAGLLPTTSSTGFTFTTGDQVRVDDIIISERPAQVTSRYNFNIGMSLSGTQLLAPSLARAQSRVTDQNIRRAETNLELDVANQYLTVLEARDLARQSQRELARSEAHVQLAQARFEVGSGTQLEVRETEYQRGVARVRVLQTANNAANDVLRLSQAVGVPLDENVELSETFTVFRPSWTPEALIALARSNSPALLASRVQAEAAAIQARSALSTYLPTISISTGLAGSYTQATDIDPLVARQMQQARASYGGCLSQNQLYAAIGFPTSTCTNPETAGFEDALRSQLADANSGFPFRFNRLPVGVSVAVNFTIFNGFQRERQVELARIGRQNAEYQARAQEMATDVEIRSALRTLETAYESSLLQEQNRLVAAERLLLAEERFRFGIATSVEVTDAQTQLAEAERAGIGSIYAFHRTLAGLEASVGQRLER